MAHATDEQLGKFTRLMSEVTMRITKGLIDSVAFARVTQIFVDKGPRLTNLLEYVLAGCPKINWSDPKAPKVKRTKLAKKVPTDTSHLRYLSSITLAATSGKVTLARSGNVFTGHLDPDLKKWGTDRSSADTSASVADIYEMKADGDFKTLFGSISNDLNSLCWTQAQIVEFCETHSELLRQDGYGTFFLFEVEGEVFVLYVCVLAGKLGCNVRRFDYDYVWSAKYRLRLVVPQQVA
jgi:hypothetical protein